MRSIPPSVLNTEVGAPCISTLCQLVLAIALSAIRTLCHLLKLASTLLAGYSCVRVRIRFGFSLFRVQRIEATAGPPIALFTLFLRLKKSAPISLLASPFRETTIDSVFNVSLGLVLSA